MDEQVDGRFPERGVLGRIIVPSERRRVQPEGVIRVAHVPLQNREPRLDEILLHQNPVAPALVDGPGIGGGVDELIVDDRTTERLSDVPRAAEKKYRRAGRRQPVSPSDGESPLDQELAVGNLLAFARVSFVEHAPKPAHGSRVEEFVGIEAVHRLLVEPIRGRVTEKLFDLVDRATFIAPAAPNERSPDITVEIDWLLAAGRLGNVEHQ